MVLPVGPPQDGHRHEAQQFETERVRDEALRAPF